MTGVFDLHRSRVRRVLCVRRARARKQCRCQHRDIALVTNRSERILRRVTGICEPNRRSNRELLVPRPTPAGTPAVRQERWRTAMRTYRGRAVWVVPPRMAAWMQCGQRPPCITRALGLTNARLVSPASTVSCAISALPCFRALPSSRRTARTPARPEHLRQTGREVLLHHELFDPGIAVVN
jgi:hypothetical protein